MAFLRKRGDIWYLYWTSNGTKRGRSLGTKQKAVADRHLKEFEYRLATQQLGQTTDVALEQLQDEFLSYKKAVLKPSSYERGLRPRVREFVEFLADRGVTMASQVTIAHIQEFQRNLTGEEKPPKPTTVRNYMFAASGLMGFAVERGYVANNVVRSVKKVKAAKNPPRYLSFEDWEKVKAVAQETHLWPLVATAYYTGFRNSELRFLTWPEIDFGMGLITLTNKAGFTLKNRQSRTVPLNTELKAILKPLKRDEGYCFLDTHGEQWSDVGLSAAFKRLVVKPSELPHFSLHAMRHTFASHLVMKGVSIYKVSQWLGHRSVDTTMIYAHLAPQDDQINIL
jgi:integrase